VRPGQGFRTFFGRSFVEFRNSTLCPEIRALELRHKDTADRTGFGFWYGHEHLPACIDALRQQDGVSFVTWFCVNQPEAWQHEPERRVVCEANQTCLHLLDDTPHYERLPYRNVPRSIFPLDQDASGARRAGE
jgi:hypothetical protein